MKKLKLFLMMLIFTLSYAAVYDVGDVNMDVTINILDVVHLIEHILSGSLEMLPYANMNDDDYINVVDVILLVNTIFDML